MITARRKGWIGVDIGSRTVKLVQVERVGVELRLREAVVIQRRLPIGVADGEEPIPVTSIDEIRTALSLGKRFSGRKAACILSMCSCDLRALDVPLGNCAEQRLEIAGQLNSMSTSGNCDREFDFWQTRVPGEQSQPDLENVSVLSVSRQWVARVAGDLSKAGLHCETLDGLPLAVARAVQITSASSSREPVGVVDWGFGRATFCAVLDGRPLFVRCLNGCGLGLITQSLCDALGVSLDEAQRLLILHGLPDSPGSQGTPDELQVVIGDVATQPLGAIVHELNRTLAFLKGQRPALMPGRIWLCGGGGTVKNITGFLESRIGVPVDTWRLECAGIQKQTNGKYPLGILAPAIAASSLAWVEQ